MSVRLAVQPAPPFTSGFLGASNLACLSMGSAYLRLDQGPRAAPQFTLVWVLRVVGSPLLAMMGFRKANGCGLCLLAPSWVKGYLFRGWTGVRLGLQLPPSTPWSQKLWGQTAHMIRGSQGGEGRSPPIASPGPHTAALFCTWRFHVRAINNFSAL